MDTKNLHKVARKVLRRIRDTGVFVVTETEEVALKEYFEYMRFDRNEEERPIVPSGIPNDLFYRGTRIEVLNTVQ